MRSPETEKNRPPGVSGASAPAGGIVYLVTLSFVLLTTHGRFTVGGLIITTLAFLAYLASPWVKSPFLGLETVLSALWLVFSLCLLIKSGLLYPQMNVWFFVFKAALLMNGICAAVHFVLLAMDAGKARARKFLLCAALILVVSCMALSLKASPAPHIDVFTICTQGADLFRSGHNPYDFLYPDIYGARYTYQPRFMYWPVVAYMVTLGRLATGDVRAANVLAYLLTAVGLYLLGRRWQWDFRTRLLVLLVWLSFPISFFVLEEAWVELLLMPSLVFFVYFADQRKWAAAAVMAGLACATKQYMIVFAVLSGLYVWRKSGWGKTFVYAGIASLVTIVTMLPFLIWNLRIFLDRTIFEILRYDIRADSLSWIAFSVNRWGAPPKAALSLALKILLIAPALVLMLRRMPPQLADLMLALVISYSAVFLLANQALCNYYDFLSFLVFLHIVLYAGNTSRHAAAFSAAGPFMG